MVCVVSGVCFLFFAGHCSVAPEGKTHVGRSRLLITGITVQIPCDGNLLTAKRSIEDWMEGEDERVCEKKTHSERQGHR